MKIVGQADGGYLLYIIFKDPLQIKIRFFVLVELSWNKQKWNIIFLCSWDTESNGGIESKQVNEYSYKSCSVLG